MAEKKRIRRWLGVIRGGRRKMLDMEEYRARKAARLRTALPAPTRPAA